jgi:hypothetical protein
MRRRWGGKGSGEPDPPDPAIAGVAEVAAGAGELTGAGTKLADARDGCGVVPPGGAVRGEPRRRMWDCLALSSARNRVTDAEDGGRREAPGAWREAAGGSPGEEGKRGQAAPRESAWRKS